MAQRKQITWSDCASACSFSLPLILAVAILFTAPASSPQIPPQNLLPEVSASPSRSGCLDVEIGNVEKIRLVPRRPVSPRSHAQHRSIFALTPDIKGRSTDSPPLSHRRPPRNLTSTSSALHRRASKEASHSRYEEKPLRKSSSVRRRLANLKASAKRFRISLRVHAGKGSSATSPRRPGLQHLNSILAKGDQIVACSIGQGTSAKSDDDELYAKVDKAWDNVNTILAMFARKRHHRQTSLRPLSL